MSAVREIASHNTTISTGNRALRRFAKLAFVAVMLSVVAVPVTCVDAHGPHSLFAPPDAQASSIAAALATHHHGHDPGHQLDGMTDSIETEPHQEQVVRVGSDGPVLTNVNLGFLLLEQHATEPDADTLLASTDLSNLTTAARITLPDSISEFPEGPPPR